VQTRTDEEFKNEALKAEDVRFGVLGGTFWRGCTRWYLLSLDTSSTIGLLQGAIRHVAVLYLSSCIFSVSLIVFLLAAFLQTTCWRALDRQVVLTILVSTLTFGFKCPFPQFLRSMRCFLCDHSWIICLLLDCYPIISFREILNRDFARWNVSESMLIYSTRQTESFQL